MTPLATLEKKLQHLHFFTIFPKITLKNSPLSPLKDPLFDDIWHFFDFLGLQKLFKSLYGPNSFDKTNFQTQRLVRTTYAALESIFWKIDQKKMPKNAKKCQKSVIFDLFFAVHQNGYLPIPP